MTAERSVEWVHAACRVVDAVLRGDPAAAAAVVHEQPDAPLGLPLVAAACCHPLARRWDCTPTEVVWRVPCGSPAAPVARFAVLAAVTDDADLWIGSVAAHARQDPAAVGRAVLDLAAHTVLELSRAAGASAGEVLTLVVAPSLARPPAPRVSGR